MRGDAETNQHVVAEPAGRLVDRVCDQHLVAGREHRQQGAGHRREAGWEQANASRALELAKRFGQGLLRREAGAAIGDLTLVIECGGGRHQHRRALFDDRTYRATSGAAGVYHLRRRTFRLAAHAGPVATAVSASAPHSLHEPS